MASLNVRQRAKTKEVLRCLYPSKSLKKERRNKIIVSTDEALHEKLMEDEIQILLKLTYRIRGWDIPSVGILTLRCRTRHYHFT